MQATTNVGSDAPVKHNGRRSRPYIVIRIALLTGGWQVLALQDENGQWSLPAGTLEQGDTSLRAAASRIIEDTIGWKAEVDSIIVAETVGLPKAPEFAIQFVVLAYAENSIVSIRPPHKSHRWVGLDDTEPLPWVAGELYSIACVRGFRETGQRIAID